MNFVNISSKALHNRRVELEDREFDAATLCPFFNRQGRVEWVMVLGDEPDIRFFQPAATEVRIPFWGAAKVRSSWGRLTELTPEKLSGLWHFDSQWMLKQSHLANHPLAPAIKASNCVEQFYWKVRAVYYSRNLQQTTWVNKKENGENTVLKFTPKMLPERVGATAAHPSPFEATPRHARRQWRLAPFWESSRGA